MKNKIVLGLVGMMLVAGCSDDENAPESSVQPPVVTEISPERGKSGIEVIIIGSNFGSTAGDNTVTFNGKIATVISASPTELVVAVPPEAGTGGVEVTVDKQTTTGPVFTWYPDNTRFVDINGSDDSNDCYKVGMPCATVGHALGEADQNDVINISAGVYTETITIDKSVALQGAGGMDEAGTIIRGHELPGEATNRVITIPGGNEVSISDIMIGNGYAPGNLHPEGSGGGIYVVRSLLDLTNVTIGFNRAGRSGGGMYMQDALGTFTNVVFTGNEAIKLAGGGLRNWNSSPLINVKFLNNKAGTYGGGVNNEEGSSPILTNVTFTGNKAGNSGGGMFNYRDSHPILREVSFDSNTAALDGGAIVNILGGSTDVTIGLFKSNSANNNGGAIWNDAAHSMTPGHVTRLQGVDFIDNSAGSYGGGIFNAKGYVELLDANFSQNVAGNQGGGLHNDVAISEVRNTVFVDNTAESGGGGMTNIESEALLLNVVFDRNEAGLTGGGMLNFKSAPELYNVTFSGNTSGANGGGMDNAFSSKPLLINCILWANEAVSNGNEIHNTSTSFTKLYYCVYSNKPEDITQGDGIATTNSIHTDPLFVNAADGNLRLSEGSPAINAGYYDSSGPPQYATDEGGNFIDLDGNPRVADSTIDIGAYEYGLEVSE